MRQITILSLCALVASALLAVQAAAVTDYVFVDLHPASAGVSYAYDVNDSGCVVGYYSPAGTPRACLWEPDGTLVDLGTLGGLAYARGISDSGVVVGDSMVGPHYHAFLWDGGALEDLGLLPSGTASGADDVNDSGVVAGWATDADDNVHACTWEDGVVTDLGTLGGDSSRARAINGQGQVVGYSLLSATTRNHACLWYEGGVTDLGDLSGGTRRSYAYDVNDSGQVVGYANLASSWDPPPYDRAFLWEDGVMTHLGALTADGSSSAEGINNLGQVVGMSEGALFFWEEGIMYDLSGFIPAGWTLTGVSAINDAGQIVGKAMDLEGITHAFLMTPVPEPAAVALGVVGAIVALRRRRRAPRAA